MQVFHCKVRNDHLETLKQFGKLSGLKFNMSKYTVLRSGSLRKHNVIFCPEKNTHWTSISATALGIVFGKQQNTTEN